MHDLLLYLIPKLSSVEVERVAALDPADPAVFWRLDNLIAWLNTVNNQSREYFDWLAPYLKLCAFRDPSYPSFWLLEVTPEEVPLCRLRGLVSFYQMEFRPTHGNLSDQLHAGHWLSSDLFMTADDILHKVLTKIADAHIPERPKPVLVHRDVASCVDQVEASIRSYVGSRR